MANNHRLITLLPAIWASLFDIILTIVHQPKEYWNGDLTKANEGNPIGQLFMSNHIAGLFIVSGFWLIAIGLLGYFLPRSPRKIFLVFCLIAHSYGASTWLAGRYGFWYAILLILFNSIFYTVTENIAQGNKAR